MIALPPLVWQAAPAATAEGGPHPTATYVAVFAAKNVLPTSIAGSGAQTSPR